MVRHGNASRFRLTMRKMDREPPARILCAAGAARSNLDHILFKQWSIFHDALMA